MANVIVKSRTVGNATVIVTLEKFFPNHLLKIGIKEERVATKSYIFKHFQAEMPLEHAQRLITERPDEFFIEGSAGEVSPTVQKAIDQQNFVVKDRELWQKCPICSREDFINKAAFMAHFRKGHVEEWNKIKEKTQGKVSLNDLIEYTNANASATT